MEVSPRVAVQRVVPPDADAPRRGSCSYYVAPTTHAGRGVFASQQLPSGFTLIREAPLVAATVPQLAAQSHKTGYGPWQAAFYNACFVPSGDPGGPLVLES